MMCNETFNTYQDEYHLQIAMDAFELQQALMEMQMSTALDNYNCPQLVVSPFYLSYVNNLYSKCKGPPPNHHNNVSQMPPSL